VRQALREDASATPRHIAEEATHAQVDSNAEPMPRAIGERALIVAVDPLARVAAEWARNNTAPRACRHNEIRRVKGDLIQL
jgi:hypothetical protein